MAIQNFKCEACNKMLVCKVYDKLMFFHEDAKKDSGVNIDMQECEHFKEEE